MAQNRAYGPLNELSVRKPQATSGGTGLWVWQTAPARVSLPVLHFFTIVEFFVFIIRGP